MLGDISVQVINLDGASERWEQAQSNLSGHGLEFERLSAVDGRGQSPDFHPLYSSLRSWIWFGDALKGAEVACYASHINAARAFLETDKSLGLVLEDDADLVEGAAEKLAALADWLTQKTAQGDDWDVVHLQGKTRRSRYARDYGSVPLSDGSVLEVVQSFDLPIGTSALLWSRGGAERFLKRCTRISGTVDNVLRSDMATKGVGLCLEPQLVTIRQVESQIMPLETDLRSHTGWYGFRSRERANWRRRAALIRMKLGR